MTSHPPTPSNPLNHRQLLEQLAAWRGTPTQYWERLAMVAQVLLSAQAVAVAMSPGTQVTTPVWQTLASTPPDQAASDWLRDVPPALTQRAQAKGVALGLSLSGTRRVGMASFRIDQGQRELFVIASLPMASQTEMQEHQILAALSWLPRVFEQERMARQSERDATRLAQVLETVGRLLSAQRLDQAALMLANDLAERFACESVSICWKAREGLRLRAISHTEKVDRRSELTALLEEAGQEALSQELEIAWPAQGKSVQRAHERYAGLQQPGHLYTLPMAQGQGAGETDIAWGSITLERQRMPFTAAEQWALRLYADMALWPLVHLHASARSLPLRIAHELGNSLPRNLLPRSVPGKRLAQSLVALVLALAFTPLPYTVTAGASVKTNAMAFVGAPFDGYLFSSDVQLGDQVKAGQTLFTVQTQELLLEQASVQADLVQASREAEKRRAVNQLPEMQVAEAQADQARAKLVDVGQKIQAASVSSPIDGVVIEGEPRKNLGGAVRRGDTVMKVAALDELYVEAAVSEKDLSQVNPGQKARLTLLAQPDHTHALNVLNIIPHAAVVNGENTFPVRLALSAEAQEWWRPGMTGVVKISVGWRFLWWIAAHRLIDYLRVALWF